MDIDLSPYIPLCLAATWRPCLVSYLLHLSNGSARTVLVHGYVLRAFLILHPDPSCVSRDEIEAFIRTPLVRNPRAGQPPSAWTRNLRLQVLKSFFQFAHRAQLISSSDSLFAGLKRAPTFLAFRGMTLDELTRLFAVIPTNTVKGLRDRALFLCYFWTARRRAEIVRLRWGDLRYGTITDNQGHSYEGWLYTFTGKGRHGSRDTAELPQPAKDAIDAYLAFSGRLATMRESDPIFLSAPRPRGGGKPIDFTRPLAGDAVWRALKEYCAKAGLDVRRINVHSFRHTAAQQRHLAGESLRSLQHLLRHSSIATTNAYLESASSAADPGSHILAKDSRFRF